MPFFFDVVDAAKVEVRVGRSGERQEQRDVLHRIHTMVSKTNVQRQPSKKNRRYHERHCYIAEKVDVFMRWVERYQISVYIFKS